MNLKKKRCIACIMAHADDIEITCGGTLAKYIAQGYKGIYGLLSLCNSGYTKGTYKSSCEITPLRIKEAKEAAEVFGAEIFRMDLLEGIFTDRTGKINPLSFSQGNYNIEDIPQGAVSLFDAAMAITGEGNSAIKRVRDLLIENAPELVIGNCIDSNNPDHFSASLIVKKAYTEASKHVELGPLYIPLSPSSFIPRHPDWIVDISGFEKVAETAISCHESQDGKNKIKRMRQRWNEWGKEIGTESAERFIRIL